MINLKSLCQDKGIAYIEDGHHHCHDGWAQIHCPFCSGGVKGYHLGYNLKFGNFNCWRCGTHGLWEVLERLLNTSDKSTVYKTRQKYKIEGFQRKRKVQVARKRNIKFPAGTEDLAPQHRRYLEKRNFDSDKLIEEWGIKGTQHLSGEWNWRIIIPIHNEKGEIAAYQGRSLNDKNKPKYKMCDDEDCLENPKSLLYGIHKIKGPSIMAVEGITDVWRLGEGVVGTLGIDWNTEQANVLRRFSRRYILFDPEPEAQRQAQKLARWLSFYPGETDIVEDFPCDPGDLNSRQLKELQKLLRN